MFNLRVPTADRGATKTQQRLISSADDVGDIGIDTYKHW
jgi:hypothetical protein